MIKKWTIEMVMEQRACRAYFPVAVGMDGCMWALDLDAVMGALNYWRETMPEQKFQVTEWAPKVLDL
jgi:hypothetical protein